MPEDIVTNTMHFEDDDDGSLQGTFANRVVGLHSRLSTFYTYLAANVLSRQLAGTGVIRYYDMTDPKPRVPVVESPLNFTSALTSSSGLPGEVAIVLSMKAEPKAGSAPGRRRGRIFLGPIVTSMVEDDGITGDIRIISAKMAGVLGAAQTMARGSGGSFRLAVYSPTTMASSNSLATSFEDVELLTMDNALDTVRSRGSRRTQRVKISAGGGNVTEAN
jgi:hypothetical protein